MVLAPVRPMHSVVKATTRSVRTSGRMALMAITRPTETVVSTNKYSEMRLYKVTVKVIQGTVVTTGEVTTMGDGVMAVGPGKFYLQSTLLEMPRPKWSRHFVLGPLKSLILKYRSNLMQETIANLG